MGTQVLPVVAPGVVRIAFHVCILRVAVLFPSGKLQTHKLIVFALARGIVAPARQS